ncbi:hypothetical protein V3C99_010472, partial [Haemonchus contortus]
RFGICTICTVVRVILFSLIYSRKTTNAYFHFSECGIMKGCLTVPRRCHDMKSCKMVFSFQVDGDYLNMEVSGKPPKQNGYAAVGFSNDDKMGEDMVVFCARQEGKVIGGLAKLGKKPTAVILDNSGVQEVTLIADENGVIYCAIRQLLYPNRLELFVLNSTYYILFASGEFSNNEMLYHAENRHVLPPTFLPAYVRGTGRIAEEHPYGDNVESLATIALKKTHGVLMVLAWTIFLSTGILFARQKQGPCPSHMLFGKQLWFQCHRTLNLIGIFAAAVAFLCMFIANNGRWSGPWPGQSSQMNWRWGSIHALLGLIACLLAFIQPLDAMLRCHPGHPQRTKFNVVHGVIGALAWVCAVVTTLIATAKFSELLNTRIASSSYVAFIVVSLQTIISTELLSLIRSPKASEEMKTKTQQSTQIKSIDSKEDKDNTKPDSKDIGSEEDIAHKGGSKEDVKVSSTELVHSKEGSKEGGKASTKELIHSKKGSKEILKFPSKEYSKDNTTSDYEEHEPVPIVQTYVDIAREIQIGITMFFVIVAVTVGLLISNLIAFKSAEQ